MDHEKLIMDMPELAHHAPHKDGVPIREVICSELSSLLHTFLCPSSLPEQNEIDGEWFKRVLAYDTPPVPS